MSVTQKDVAKLAGVSFITVSRVVNNKGNVAPETKKRVLEAIKKTGYALNVTARALCINATNSIGISFAGYISESPFFAQMLRGIENVCLQNGYNILLYTSKGEHGIINYEEAFKERLVDGLIVMAPDITDKKIEKLIEMEIPFVIINGRYKNANYVDTDNISGAEKAVDYLIQLGHKRIAYVNGWKNLINCRHRLAGYKRALLKNKIDFDEKLIFQGNFDVASGERAAEYFLSLENPPTAIFAANDLMAIGMIKKFKKMGLNIPEDISIIGFDDIEISSLIIPSLSTVRQPIIQIGEEATKILINSIKEKNSKKVQMVLQTELIIRETCKKIKK